MPRGARQIVDDDPVARLDEQNPAAMHDGLRRGCRRCVRRRENPAPASSAIRAGARADGCRHPNGPAGSDWLWPSTDDGVVRRGAAEVVAPVGFRRVAVVAGVDEARLAEDRTLHAEQIGVPMPAAHRTPERTDVHDHLVRAARPTGLASPRSRRPGRLATRARPATPAAPRRTRAARRVRAARALPAPLPPPPRRSRRRSNIAAAGRERRRGCRRAHAASAAAASRRPRRRSPESIRPAGARQQEVDHATYASRQPQRARVTPLRAASSRKCR